MDATGADAPQPRRQTARLVGPAPVAPAAVGLILGILWDAWVPVDWRWYAAGFAATAASLLWPAARGRYAVVVAMVAAACVGGLLHHGSFRRLPPDHVFHFTTEAPAVARLRGTVLTAPRVFKRDAGLFARWSYESYKTSFFVEAEAIESPHGFVVTRGRVRVTVKDAAMAIREADRVELFGFLHRPVPPSNPGSFDWSLRDRRDGVFAAMSCDRAENVRRLPDGARGALPSALAAVRRHVRGLLLGDMMHHGGADMTLLDAIVLGQRGAIDPKLNEAFVRTGCAHFLAVSGMNVCMLAAAFWLVGRLAGLNRRAGAMLTVLVTVVYTLLVEPLPPILRAAVMILVYCASLLLYRAPSTSNAIALAAAILLCCRPTALFDVGFQLSFMAVLGIVYLSPAVTQAWFDAVAGLRRLAARRPLHPLEEQPPDPRGWRTAAIASVRNAFCIAVAAWLASLPLVLIYFQRIPLWGWLNTVLLAPLVFVVMVASLFRILCGLAFPMLGGAIGPIVEYPTAALSWSVELLSRIPGVNPNVPAPPAWLAATYYLALAAWVCAHRRPDWWRRAAEAAVEAIERARVRIPRPSESDALTVTILPATRGGAAVLELPGAVLLYGAGRGPDDAGGSILRTFLRRRRIDHVNLVLLSHPDRAGFGDLIDVIDRFPTGPVCITPHFEELAVRDVYAAELLRRLRGRQHPVTHVTSETPAMHVGDVRVEFLWPPRDAPFVLDRRNSSLVVRLSRQGRSVLLCGDIRDDAQAWLAHRVDVRTDVIVLPHPGAVSQSTPRLVAEAAARHLICSRTPKADAEDSHPAIPADCAVHDVGDSSAARVRIAGGRLTVRRVAAPAAPDPRRMERMPARILAALTVLGVALWCCPTSSRGGLTMTALSVGRASAVVLEMPDGRTVLYDAGTSGSYDAGSATIVPYLRHRGVRRVDRVLLSHGNFDHFGGLLSVIDRFTTGSVVVSPHFERLSSPDDPSGAVLAELRKRNHPLEIITPERPAMRFGDAALEILWPPADPPFPLDANNSSLVVRVRYAGVSILLTGDIGPPVQQWLVDHADVAADVLLLPHHGGTEANRGPFIAAVNPRYVIRSTSQRTEPDQDDLAPLLSGRRLFNTADVGAVTVRIDPVGLHIAGFRTAASP